MSALEHVGMSAILLYWIFQKTSDPSVCPVTNAFKAGKRDEDPRLRDQAVIGRTPKKHQEAFKRSPITSEDWVGHHS